MVSITGDSHHSVAIDKAYVCTAISKATDETGTLYIPYRMKLRTCSNSSSHHQRGDFPHHHQQRKKGRKHSSP